MKFGHHQSFYLRLNWLAKAYKMQGEDKYFFTGDQGFEQIGLGKNMVKSLRYWVVALQVAEERRDEQRKTYHELTEAGRLIKENDRFVRLPLTAGVLHILLSTNVEHASTWYWFFNVFHHRAGDNEQVLKELEGWVKAHHSRPVSSKTLKRDLDCLRLVYTAEASDHEDPEEVVASPLSALRLLQPSRDQFIKRTPELDELNLDALYFALLLYCKKREVDSVSIDELQVKPELWGKLFQLSSNQMLLALEQMQEQPRYAVQLIRTNRLNQVRLEPMEPTDFLRTAYYRKAAK